MGYEKIWIPKNIRSRKKFGSQKDLGPKKLGPKKSLGPKTIWVQKKFSGSKKTLDIWRKFGSRKKIWVPKNFGSNKFGSRKEFGPKNLNLHNNFVPKILDPKRILVQIPSRSRHLSPRLPISGHVDPLLHVKLGEGS